MASTFYQKDSSEALSVKLEPASSSSDSDDDFQAPKQEKKAARFKPTKTASFREKEKASFNQGKLIGIRNVAAATGDDMCKEAMKALKLEKGRKKLVVTIAISEAEIKFKDEQGSETIHPFPKISYLYRHPKKRRSFGYVYGSPETGHGFVAFKVTHKSADTLVGAIHHAKQQVDRAKKRPDDTTSNGSGDSRNSNADARVAFLENQLAEQRQMIEKMASSFAQMNKPTPVPDISPPWTAFGNSVKEISPSRTTSVYDPWSPESVSANPDIATPGMFTREGQFEQTPITVLPAASAPKLTPQSFDTPTSALVTQSSPITTGDTSYNILHDYTWFSPNKRSSVFDEPPLVPQPPKEKITDQKVFADIVKSGLEGSDIGNTSQTNFVNPRCEKPSKNSFPQPIKKMMGDSVAVAPAATTVDPFHVTPFMVAPPDFHAPATNSSQLVQVMAPLKLAAITPTQVAISSVALPRTSLVESINPWIGDYEEDGFFITKVDQRTLAGSRCVGCTADFLTAGEEPHLALVLVRKEQDYITGSGKEIIGNKEEKRYHMFTSCVKLRHPTFNPRRKGLVVVNVRWYNSASKEERDYVDLFKEGSLE